jgi:transposase-like protein
MGKKNKGGRPPYGEEVKKQAMKLYYEGNSGRAVGRILGMSKANVYRWIKEMAENLPKNEEKSECETIEMDEMYVHIGSKKTKHTS